MPRFLVIPELHCLKCFSELHLIKIVKEESLVKFIHITTEDKCIDQNKEYNISLSSFVQEIS